MRAFAMKASLALVEEAHAQGQLCVAQPAQRKRLARLMDTGLVVRPYPHVYATREFWDAVSVEKRILCSAKALAALHPTWVFAGTTAALAHGLSVGYAHLGKICIAQRRGIKACRLESIQRITVSGDAPTTCQGLQVTSFLRTIYDCIRLLPFPDALAIADSALRIRNISRDALRGLVGQYHQHKPGLHRVKEIIDLADGRAENGGESFARAQMISLGFAVPDLQRPMPDPLHPEKNYRVDFAWDLPDGSTVIGELDGWEKYTNPEMTGGKSVNQVLFDERRREAHVTLSNRPIRVMRFSLAETKRLYEFERLLNAYGIPRIIGVPEVARR